MVAGDRAYRREIAPHSGLGYLLFAFAAGVVLPFQAGVNAQLADWLHSPARAAFVSFLVGTLVLLATAALGGAFGAFYVVGSIVSAPKLDAATLIALVVAGQRSPCLTTSGGWGSRRST